MNLLTILVAILVFAVLVIVHEFGHFIVAKRSGVFVQEFAIGFPPRLWGFKRGETQYSINMLPLGGYVLMPGENGETVDDEGKYNPRNFGSQPAWKRAAILVAGVSMNLLLAVVIYTGIFALVGTPKDLSVIGQIEAGTPAQSVGLKTGDRILTVNGQSVSTQEDVIAAITAAISADKTNSANVPVTLVVQRGSSQFTVTPAARRNPPTGQGKIGFGFEALYNHPPVWQTPGMGVHQVFVTNFQVTGAGIHQVLAGIIPAKDAFSGPVGIVKVTSQVTNSIGTEGFAPLFYLMAYLSWNLAIVNLLPIPGLDGGRLLILGIEVLRRGRRLTPEREAMINLAGMVFLLSLIALFTINDISNIVSGH